VPTRTVDRDGATPVGSAMGEVENVVASAGCARVVPATVPAQAAAQASILSVIRLNLGTRARTPGSDRK
jgi:hypothetical protein